MEILKELAAHGACALPPRRARDQLKRGHSGTCSWQHLTPISGSAHVRPLLMLQPGHGTAVTAMVHTATMHASDAECGEGPPAERGPALRSEAVRMTASGRWQCQAAGGGAYELDAVALEEAGGILPELAVVRREDVVHELDDADADVVHERRVQAPHVLGDHVVELRRDLDARRAAADDHKREQLLAVLQQRGRRWARC